LRKLRSDLRRRPAAHRGQREFADVLRHVRPGSAEVDGGRIAGEKGDFLPVGAGNSATSRDQGFLVRQAGSVRDEQDRYLWRYDSFI
jgi:hypothetical protein